MKTSIYQKDLKKRRQRRRASEKHRTEIKIWMMRKGLKNRDIAEAVGVSDMMVSHYLHRIYRDPKITAWLIAQGCPEKHFDKDNRVKAA